MTTWAELQGTWSEIEGTWATAPLSHSTLIFQPPIREEIPRVVTPMREADERFWNYWHRGPVGVNVFKLTDGTYTESQPWDDTTIKIWYLGGHIYEVDATEAASLRAAGYTVIGDIPVVTPAGGPLIGDFVGTTIGSHAGRTIGSFGTSGSVGSTIADFAARTLGSMSGTQIGDT